MAGTDERVDFRRRGRINRETVIKGRESPERAKENR
jgi:hypothetical protein